MQKESCYHSVQNLLHENDNDLSEINEADPTRSCGEYSLLEFLVRGSHSTDSTKKKKSHHPIFISSQQQQGFYKIMVRLKYQKDSTAIIIFNFEG
jgi:hypothetical protein